MDVCSCRASDGTNADGAAWMLPSGLVKLWDGVRRVITFKCTECTLPLHMLFPHYSHHSTFTPLAFKGGSHTLALGWGVTDKHSVFTAGYRQAENSHSYVVVVVIKKIFFPSRFQEHQMSQVCQFCVVNRFGYLCIFAVNIYGKLKEIRGNS